MARVDSLYWYTSLPDLVAMEGNSLDALKREVKCVIFGEACSKANSRRLVHIGGKPRFIKSKKALLFEKAVAAQAPRLNELLEGDLEFRADIYYASRRPDLDESMNVETRGTSTCENAGFGLFTVRAQIQAITSNFFPEYWFRSGRAIAISAVTSTFG